MRVARENFSPPKICKGVLKEGCSNEVQNLTCRGHHLALRGLRIKDSISIVELEALIRLQEHVATPLTLIKLFHVGYMFPIP